VINHTTSAKGGTHKGGREGERKSFKGKWDERGLAYIHGLVGLIARLEQFQGGVRNEATNS
jgi:hypothetical protein